MSCGGGKCQSKNCQSKRRKERLEKYDKPVPRYTSYPTVPSWEGISKKQWIEAAQKQLSLEKDTGISLYVHVPFCRSLCSFCACTKVISRDYTQAEDYVETVLFELDSKLQDLDVQSPNLAELHFGGGTPTWLPPENLKTLLEGIRSRFQLVENLAISIEVDPRTCSSEHVEVMAEMGVNRVSLGVQDFHEPTLKAIKRMQSYEMVESLCLNLRAKGIHQINFDLVYGLPHQTPDTLTETMVKLKRLRPTRIALYSYAHVPQLKKAQVGVEKHGLPTGAEKRELYETCSKLLKKTGYQAIGMDHFALESDELYVAYRRKKLHRNFMGYTTQSSKVLLGLGPSSLSDCNRAYMQNPKDVALWREAVRAENLQPVGGHFLTQQERELAVTIRSLMCHFEAVIPDFVEVEKSELVNQWLKEGLIRFDPVLRLLEVAEEGQIFIRNLCAELDPSFASAGAAQQGPENRPLYSRSI